MAHYDRDNALDYARRFWNVVCDDLKVAIGHEPWFRTVAAGTIFVKDGTGEHAQQPGGETIPWSELDDCSHYLSCCFGKGGGLPIPRTFIGVFGILGAPKLIEWLLGHGHGVIKKKRAKIDGSTDIDTFISAGDLIGYYDSDRGRYGHAALYLGDGKIACHTYCRSDLPACTWDNTWKLGGASWTVDLIQIQ